ncbi:MAG: catalase HPII [Candidatus Eremiobacteraeota bacterium]|nr:catalase HPII [Candidatus Eremiobacteraeota bacterium]
MAGKKLRNLDALKPFRSDATGQELTTNQGVPVADDQNSLRAGERGPTLLEDFIMREKITHFDHERIPERVVHARGQGAHGFFEVYKPMTKHTRAAFLQDPAVRTPVFVRFSTVGGSRGSADTVRDVRGFAVKFYTTEGNYDLVGNNMPVFFIQDAIKFPDFVHAVKPEPHNEIPQASSAHDTFWDFVSLTTEATHMVMWLMSDRAIPRSLRMMEGFGVHTFRLVNSAGKGTFVKFHWKPLLGVHSLAWDEAQKLAGKDGDFNRRDLWESIDSGNFPEWELGVQLFSEEQADSFDFDVLDPTKLVPEELIPVQRIGRMVLDRNPDDFFAETEQVAFCAAHVVPGIDFTNDPLLQGRIFSYLDTQLSRLGGPNFHELPINRPQCPFNNNQRDGMHRQSIGVPRVAYEPNSINDNWPVEVKNGFQSYLESIAGPKRRVRAESFKEHFVQATLFWNSQTDVEKTHIVKAFSFELSKLERPQIRERMVGVLANVDATLAARVADNLGLKAPRVTTASSKKKSGILESKALSMLKQEPGPVATRKVAVLAADGVDAAAIKAMRTSLSAQGVQLKVLAAKLGTLKAADGTAVPIDHTILTMPSVVFDGLFVPGGTKSIAALSASADAIHFVQESYRHCKPLCASGEGTQLLERGGIASESDAGNGVITASAKGRKSLEAAFLTALSRHRFWQRESVDAVPA